MTRIQRSTLPLFAALLLLGQGPLCELACAPNATAAPVAEQALPPCHGPESDSEQVPAAPEHSEHECTVCDQVAASASGASKTAAPLAALTLGAGPHWSSAAALIEWRSFRPPDDRAPPWRGRDLLLRKSSLLL